MTIAQGRSYDLDASLAAYERGDWIELAHTGSGWRNYFRKANGKIETKREYDPATKIEPIKGQYDPA